MSVFTALNWMNEIIIKGAATILVHATRSVLLEIVLYIAVRPGLLPREILPSVPEIWSQVGASKCHATFSAARTPAGARHLDGKRKKSHQALSPGYSLSSANGTSIRKVLGEAIFQMHTRLAR